MNKNSLIPAFCLLFALLAFYRLGATTLSGTYTIDSSLTVGTASNFKNFASVIAYLTGVGSRTDGGPANSAPFGISGPVVFNVSAGTYVERVAINLIPGISPVNTITFDGGVGNKTTRIIRYNATSTSNRATVQINKCPYITFSNLTIETIGTTYGWGIQIMGNSPTAGQSSNGCKIKNCVIQIGGGGPTSSSSANFNGIIINNNATSATTGGRIDSLEIDSNTIRGGGYGIIARGAPALMGLNNKFRNNTIIDSYVNGILLYYQSKSETNDNTITLRAGTPDSYGIYMSSCATFAPNNHFIVGNRIFNAGSYGIVIEGSNHTAVDRSIVANNSIAGGFQNNIGAGIYVTSSQWGIFHNSVNLDMIGTTNISTAALRIALNNASDRVCVYNNLLAVTGSGLGLAFHIVNASHIDSMDYNLFYTINPGNLIYVGNNFNLINFAGAAGFNVHSVAANPNFTSNADLRINSFCNRGFYISSIPTDITGTLRSDPPAIGSYEYSGINNITVDAIKQPAFPVASGIQNLVVRIKNTGNNTVSSFTTRYNLNGTLGAPQSWTGTLAPCDTALITFTGVNLLSENTLAVYTSSPNAVSDSYKDNDTLKVIANVPLNGVYTIGKSGANFSSFNAAIERLNAGGVSGAVTFNVQGGTYPEQVIIRDIIGASATNTITFKSAVNNADSVILDYPVGISGAVIKLDNANYIRFKYLTVKSATTSSKAFELIESSSYDSIIYCKTTAGTGIYAGNFQGRKNVFSNNTITGGSQGIYLNGRPNLPTDSNIITSNMIKDTRVVGMSFDNGTNTLVANNSIVNAETGITNFSGNNQRFYHNSINAKNYGISVSYDVADNNNAWRNNLITHSAVGSAALIYDNSGTNNTWDYNLYYTANASEMFYYLINSPTAYATWRGTGQDANSVVMKPGFVSETDLRLKKDGCGKGIFLASVNKDQLDSLRNNPPTIGAFEYSFVNDLAIDSTFQEGVTGGITPGSQPFTVKIKNTGTTTVTSFSLNYVLNSASPVTQPWTGTLAPCATVLVTFPAPIVLGTANRISVYTNLVNGVADGNPVNDTIKAALYARLNGTYTIGSSGADFVSFNEAVTRLADAQGVSGPVIFNVKTGTYNEKVIIPAVFGVSNINLITFQSAVSNADSVVLSYASVEDSAVVKLYSTRYINFKQITVTSTIGMAFDIAEASSYNSVNACNIYAAKTGIYCGSRLNAAGNPEKFYTGRKNVFSNNVINVSGAGVLNITNMAGIFIENKSSNSFTDGDSIIITNNTITSNLRAAIYLTYTTAVQILNNKIIATTGAGIQTDFTVDSCLVANNSIICNSTTGQGIRLTFGELNRFYHNSILTLGSEAVYQSGSNFCQWKNNIFANMGIGSASNSILGTNNVWNYNLYYTNGVKLLTSFVDFPTWQAGGNDLNSSVMNPGFLSSANLRLADDCNKTGTAILGITTDIVGRTRNTPPTIGAYEVSGIDNIALNALLTPAFKHFSKGVQSLVVRIKNAGSNTLTSANIKYVLNNGTPVSFAWSGILIACDTISVTIPGINLLSKNTLKVYTDAPNGTIDTDRENDTIKVVLNSPLKGVYTIGPAVTDSFPTLNAAVTALNNAGVSGNVIFNIKSGTYNGQLVIDSITGASDTSTITFKSVANHPDSVILNYAAGTNIPIVTLESSGYINFKSITVASTTTFGDAFRLSGIASRDTITNCKLIAGNKGISTSTNFAGNKNVLSYNTITNATTGISLSGMNATVFVDSNIISYNTINATTGMLIERTQNTKVRNNTITVNSNTQGILSQNNRAGLEISGNKITQTLTGEALTVNSARGTRISPVLIANNIIVSTSGNAFVTSGSAHLRVYHNTIISVDARGAQSASVAADSVNEWRNNIIASMGTGTNSSAASFTNTGINNTWNNNLYYTGGSFLFASSATAYDLWRKAGQDKKSVVYRPAFFSLTNLQSNPADTASWALNGRGAHLDSMLIRTDVNGNPRPLAYSSGVPDIGAYEFTPTSQPPLATAFPDFITPFQLIDSTQLFLFAGDTVARIKWSAANDIPKLQVRQYSGVRPPGIAAPLNHMFFYTQIDATGSGPYFYDLNVYFKDNWTGTNPNINDIRLIQKNPASLWSLLGASTIDVNTNVLTQQYLTSIPKWLTGTDQYNPLPVKLTAFGASVFKDDVLLSWSTASEVNTEAFIVEKSTTNGIWATAGKIKATSNTSSISSYSLTDYSAFTSPTVYYRLKIVDENGSYEYSKTVSVNKANKAARTIVAYPNPFSDNISLELISEKESSTDINITDITGRSVLNQESRTIKSGNNLVIIDLDTLHSGIYFLSVDLNGEKQLIKLIKQ